MSSTSNVVEVSAADFEQLVIANSHQVPVLVDYWAEWCGPCQMQLPILLGLAETYAGKFLLAKVDTDKERDLAAAHNIRSIPTMKLFRNGEVVEEILGAQTESTLRALIEPYIPRASDAVRAEAAALLEHGNWQAALELLREAHREEPDNVTLALEFASAAVATNELDAAQVTLDGLDRDARESELGKRIQAQLDLARAAASGESADELQQRITSNADDLDARHQLAALHASSGDYEGAMQQYLEILGRDRGFGDDAGRLGLLKMFELLGNSGELVSRYRRKMASLLY